MSLMSKIKVLFVCLGNICRSPTAEGVFRKLSSQHSELDNLEIDSCGISGYHQNEPSDRRSVSTAKARGYDLTGIRSRKIRVQDLRDYDYILAMDNSNLESLKELAINNGIRINKINLFTYFSAQNTVEEIPDPYYGGSTGFDDVITLIENASMGLIEHLIAKK